MTTFATPAVAWAGSRDADAPLVVLLHGRGSNEHFAGGLLLDHPTRYAGAAILSGTLPFDAGVPTTAGRLDRVRVLVAHGDEDNVIPRDLLERTWQYLHDGSGATVVGVRDPGGHGISAGVLAKLNDWLSAVLAGDGTLA